MKGLTCWVTQGSSSGAGVVLVVGPWSWWEPAVRKALWLEIFLLAQLPSEVILAADSHPPAPAF